MVLLQRVKQLLIIGDACLDQVSNFISNPFSMTFAEECNFWLSLAENCRIILHRIALKEIIQDDMISFRFKSFLGRYYRLFKLYNQYSPHIVYRHNVDKQIFDWEK